MNDDKISSSIIWYILQNKKITEYLESKGHRPFKIGQNGRLSYLCPFSDHKETKPSFVVFTNSEYENFMCFGCQRNYHIIHLVSELEGISFKEAVKQLGIGMNFTLEDDIDAQLKMIDREYQRRRPYEVDFGVAVYSIASLCRVYLQSVQNDPAEKSIIDKLYSQVDDDIFNCRLDSVEDIALNLPQILAKRKEKWLCK